MQGNSEIREKFQHKQKDPSKSQFNRADKNWRKRRQNRNEEV
jgi:hypothetical protein